MIRTFFACFLLITSMELSADDSAQQRGSAVKLQSTNSKSSYPAKLPPQKQPAPKAPPEPTMPPPPDNYVPKNTNPEGKSHPSTPNPSGRSTPGNPSGSTNEPKSKDTLALNEEISLCSRCQSHALAENQLPPNNDPAPLSINPPERPILKKGCNVWIRGELLVWKAQEDNLTYCTTSSSPSHFEEVLQHPEASLQWGYRLDAGYNMPRDGWDLEMQYTQIRNTGRNSSEEHGARSVSPTLLPNESFLLPGDIDKSTGKWKVKLNQVDFVLGREYATGEFLTLRPYGGARSTWIYQTFNAFYRYHHPHNKQDIFQKNHFWGFGFVAGLGTDWKLGWNLSLYGDVGYSLLLGFFDVGQKGKIEQSTLWNFDRSFRSGKSVLDIDLGIKWAKLFAEGDWAMAFKVGYEYHLYFSQNQFLYGQGTPGFQQTKSPGGDLAFQGLILSGQFDF